MSWLVLYLGFLHLSAAALGDATQESRWIAMLFGTALVMAAIRGIEKEPR